MFLNAFSARLFGNARGWPNALFTAAALTIAAPSPAPAQAAAAAQPAEQPPPPPTPVSTAGWRDGFILQSSDGDYRLAIGMVAQVDGRFSLDDPAPVISTFVVRKARPTFTGRIARYFDFKVMPDFGSGTTVLVDGYLDIRFSPAFRIRTGKDKTPIGYELLEGDAFLLFPERALASNLVPNRDIGVQVQGDLADTKVTYAAGVFNGIPDGTSSAADLDTNNSKDLAGRIVVQPFRSARTPAGVLNGFGFHVGGSTGKQAGALPTFRTSFGQTYFSYASGVAATGTRDRVSPAVFLYYKTLGAFAEYMRSSQAVARDDVHTRVTNRAWDVTASLVLTGEAASYTGVRPKNNFDPAAGHWGALQMLGRYTVLTVDRDAFTAGLAAAGASRQAKAFALAANWYPTANIKYYATFERTVFDGNTSGSRAAENAVVIRAQLAF